MALVFCCLYNSYNSYYYDKHVGSFSEILTKSALSSSGQTETRSLHCQCGRTGGMPGAGPLSPSEHSGCPCSAPPRGGRSCWAPGGSAGRPGQTAPRRAAPRGWLRRAGGPGEASRSPPPPAPGRPAAPCRGGGDSNGCRRFTPPSCVGSRSQTHSVSNHAALPPHHPPALKNYAHFLNVQLGLSPSRLVQNAWQDTASPVDVQPKDKQR